MGIIGLQASKEVKRMRKESTGDPFINLPDELFLGILTLLPSREVCQLRLQNKYIRNFIDNSEEARSIDIYVRHDAREAEPWDDAPCAYYGRLHSGNGYVKVTDAVAKTVLDLWSEPILTDTFCDESLILDAFVQLHHVQRLLADDERKGRFEDNCLCVARNALRSKLLVICSLEREYVWPVDRG